MLIKILKGEEIFSEQGLHICDDNGIAIITSEDTECEVNERVDFVQQLLTEKRLNRGLDKDGNPIVIEEPQPEIIPEVTAEVIPEVIPETTIEIAPEVITEIIPEVIEPEQTIPSE